MCMLFRLIAQLLGIDNMILTGLGIIPSAPMLAGLVAVVRKIGAEKQDVPLFSTFFKAVRGNYSPFLFHGLVLYMIVACSIFAVLYYGALAPSDMVYTAILILYVTFIVVLSIVMFYVPVLTVTYEMKLGEIYKTSFSLVASLFWKNIAALLIIAAVSAAFYFGISFTDGALRIIIACAAGALLPLVFVYTSVSITAKDLQELMGDFSEPEKPENETPVIKTASPDGGYVFVGGKMIKTKKTDDE